MRILFMAAALAAALANPLAAASLPQSGRLDFDVIRKGKDIGDYGYRFSGTDKAFLVQVSTKVVVKIPIVHITAYSFNQSSTETWKNGKLAGLKSSTNDDGTPHELNTGTSPLLPASLWDMDIVHAKKLLNTIDGSVMAVKTADLGSESVPVSGGKITAHHYRISGDLNRDVWYDAHGNLARVVFKGDDGSTVTYKRK